jgi:hypothetical protein
VSNLEIMRESRPMERMELEVDIVPDAPTISTTQRLVDALSGRILSDVDASWRLGMAIHELLDNARKYGREPLISLRFAIEPVAAGHHASISVRSRARAEDIAVVQRLAGEMKNAADPWSFYTELTRRVASRRDDSSGLGLARIWVEGEMIVDVLVEHDEYLCVRAQLAVPSPGGLP